MLIKIDVNSTDSIYVKFHATIETEDEKMIECPYNKVVVPIGIIERENGNLLSATKWVIDNCELTGEHRYSFVRTLEIMSVTF